MKRNQPSRSIPVPNYDVSRIPKKPRKSNCPTVVYFGEQKPSSSSSQPQQQQQQQKPQAEESYINEEYRDPGMIVMDQLTSAFSTSEEMKPEIKPEKPGEIHLMEITLGAPTSEQPSPSSNGEVSDTEDPTDPAERFTTRKKLEVKQLIQQHQCTIKPCKDPQMREIIANKDDTLLAYQCAMCLSLFSPITKSHLRKHLRKCSCKTNNQQPYVFTEAEKKQMNMHLAELAAIDGKYAAITETESFKKFINYIGNVCFVVGRSSTLFSITPDFLPSTSEIRGTFTGEVAGLVGKFQTFLLRKSDLHYTIILDFTSLRYNNLGIAIQFLYEWEPRTVILAVYENNEVSSSNVKTVISNIKNKFGINFDAQFIVADEASKIAAAAFDSSEYTVCACQSLNTVIKRTTSPHKKSKRNQINIELDEDILAQVTTVQQHIDDLKKVFTPDALVMLGIKLKDNSRWMSKFYLIQAWLNLDANGLNRLMEYYGSNQDKIEVIQNLINNQNVFESYIIVMSTFYDKIKLLNGNSAPTINHVLIAYYELEDHLTKFTDSDKPLLKALSTSALKVLQNKISNFTHPIHFAACALDIFQRGKIYQLRGTTQVQKARAETEALFVKYISQNTVTAEEVSVVGTGLNSYFMDPNDIQEFNNHEIIDAAKNELSKYYRYLPLQSDIQRQNVLKFWKARESSFPNLSKFANYILSIPASSNSIQKVVPELSNRISKYGETLNAAAVSDFLFFKSVKSVFGIS